MLCHSSGCPGSGKAWGRLMCCASPTGHSHGPHCQLSCQPKLPAPRHRNQAGGRPSAPVLAALPSSPTACCGWSAPSTWFLHLRVLTAGHRTLSSTNHMGGWWERCSVTAGPRPCNHLGSHYFGREPSFPPSSFNLALCPGAQAYPPVPP